MTNFCTKGIIWLWDAVKMQPGVNTYFPVYLLFVHRLLLYFYFQFTFVKLHIVLL